MYFQLLRSLADLDRCHCGPEMELAYQILVEHYPEARLLRYNKNEVNKWRRPPYWHCRSAELVDEAGRVIVSRESHNLAVFSYSPAIDTTISLDEQQHLFSDPGRPDHDLFPFPPPVSSLGAEGASPFRTVCARSFRVCSLPR